ncbi:PEP/pyruvate-binding domain-containing protein [Peptoclostridium litorale]|uniref:PEP/pyruvate-binding domain-containing protein n=1 Tax=Peptoclostridium litorale TaxID=1557 RepID=UPI0013566F4D|nr:PEP/pyruvate-binding domain-containing protein [Peptoclostridium litorale]
MDRACEYPIQAIGRKSRNLSICKREGFNVPDGFCINTKCYRRFLAHNKLNKFIKMEISKKPFEDMRWEELWDASLRIQSAFIKAEMPSDIELDILNQLSRWSEGTSFAIRSSSPQEDTRAYSFAGIYESYVDVKGALDVLDKVKLVWASLWSDRSLLYKNEISLDVLKSSMAVLVQRMEYKDVSGIAFTANPISNDATSIIIEAIEGSLDMLVSNLKTPERIQIDKASGNIKLIQSPLSKRLLEDSRIRSLQKQVLSLEKLFNEPVDVEWTGLGEDFTVLQVRPITGLSRESSEEKQWYLTLTPKMQQLVDLANRVEHILIPQLMQTCERFAGTSPEGLSKEALANALRKRGESYDYWTSVYQNEFIPFAHGIRQFGLFYNEIIHPQDPYEFMDLLEGTPLMAESRNREMNVLAESLRHLPSLKNRLQKAVRSGLRGERLFKELMVIRQRGPEEEAFIDAFLKFLKENMNTHYQSVNLNRAPEISLNVIIKLSESPLATKHGDNSGLQKYISQYFEKAGDERKKEAEQWLRIGRVSWRLRDDDNILLGKLENQLLAFMQQAAILLKNEGLLDNSPADFVLDDWIQFWEGLTNKKKVQLSSSQESAKPSDVKINRPSQRIGQPSSPGVFTGTARVIRSLEDFESVKSGEVLVFDAVEPQMTFIIPLAGAIVERRGGMLVHSSIIAREMNIPAVNGISRATEWIRTGDIVTVNGDIGVVLIGKPSFKRTKSKHGYP